MKTALLAIALVLLATSTADASPKWYRQIGTYVTTASTQGTALYRCPQLSGGRIVGKPCAATQAKRIGTSMSSIASLSAGAATYGICVASVKSLQRAAGKAMLTALTFAAAQPSGVAANIGARTGVLNSVASVLRRQAAIATCLAAR